MKIKWSVLLIGIVLLVCSCKQKDKYFYDYATETKINTDTTMINKEKFNWEIFNEQDGLSFTKDTGQTYIYMVSARGSKAESISYNDSYYTDTKIYYLNCDGIQSEGKEFTRGGWKSGIWKYYDEEGRLTHTIDYDQPFTFGIEKVLAYMKKRDMVLATGYDHDPNINTRNEIFRCFWEGYPYWKIQYSKDGMRYEITLDGKNGKVIEDDVSPDLAIM